MTKKFVSVFLSLVMCLTLAVPAFAAAETEGDCTNELILVKVESFDLTEEDAIKLLMEKKGYTREEAKAKVRSSHKMTPYNTTSGVVSHNYQRKTYTHGGFSVEIGGLYEYWTNGQYRQINDLLDMWTGAIGGGPFTWNEFSLADTTLSYPNHTSKLMATGCIEVAVDVSVSASMEATLLGSGFTSSGTIGTTEYFRKVIDMTLIYTVY